jgi:hypothetical protein
VSGSVIASGVRGDDHACRRAGDDLEGQAHERLASLPVANLASVADEIEETLDELYGHPLGDFTAARNAAASALRKQGLAEEAEQVKALKKPSTAAWALNQLPREHAKELDAFLSAATALRDAQLSGRGDMQAATRAERDALDKTLAAAERALGDAASAAVLDKIRQSLITAAVDDQAADELRQGRLERELESAGFGSLAAHAPARPVSKLKPVAERSRKPKPERPRPDAKAVQRARDQLARAEAKRDQARAALDALEREVEDARRKLEAASLGAS